MIPLLAVLKLFINSVIIYNKYNIVLDTIYIKENYKELYKVFKTVQIFREKKQSENFNDFVVFFFSQFPGMRPDDTEVFNAIFERMHGTVVSEEQILEYLAEYKKKETATKIAQKALEVAEGRAGFEEIIALANDIEVTADPQENHFVTDSLEELYQVNVAQPGYRWRLATLNRMLGSLRKGNFGVIAARPEMGKTTLIADQVTFMAPQRPDPVLWVNNEQAGSEVKSRCYQAHFGITTGELYKNRRRYEEEFKKSLGGKILLHDNANAGRRDIAALCKSYRPGLIVFDQIDKIKGFEADRHDLLLKAIYQWARELSKEYGPVIGICQAGGTAEGKKWLGMNDIDSSHTAKQGEADWILGMGAVSDEQFQSERYFHLMKNKLMGDEDTLPALRHGKCPVRIRPDIARFEDVLKW